MTARLSKRAVLAAGVLLFLLATFWLTHHALAVNAAATGRGGNRFTIIYAFLFVMLIAQTGLAHVERPYRITRDRQRTYLDNQIVVGIVPCYNEDPGALRATLVSMIDQSRRPDIIAVVDDGSPLHIQAPVPLTPAQQRHNRRDARWGWLRALGVRVRRAVTPRMVQTAGPGLQYEAMKPWFYDECERHGISPL